MTSESPQESVLLYKSDAAPIRFAPWLCRPLGWVYFSSMVLACLATLMEARVPNSPAATIFLLVSLLWFGGTACLRTVIHAALLKIHHRPFQQFWPGLSRAMIAAGILVGLCMLMVFGVPSNLAFWVTEPEMRHIAESIIAKEGAAAVPATQSIKYPAESFMMFRAYEIEYDPDHHTVFFFIEGSSLIDKCGWAFTRDPVPADNYEGAFYLTPHSGPWYWATD